MREDGRMAQGSLTAEAAFSVPVIFMAWLAFLYFFQILRIQEELHYAAFEAVRTAAGYGYLAYEAGSAMETIWEDGRLPAMDEAVTEELIWGLAGDISAELFYKNMMLRYLDRERIEHSCIHKGFAGISAAGSEILTEDMCAQIILRYRIVIPVPLFSELTMPVTQRIRVRSFTGEGDMPETEGSDGEGEDAETKAYIVGNGQVYHTKPDCTYIRISVTSERYENLPELRNENGKRYEKCRYCSTEQGPSDRIYITRYGEAYHSDLNCSRIKRTVRTISMAQARETYRICSKCAKEEREE